MRQDCEHLKPISHGTWKSGCAHCVLKNMNIFFSDCEACKDYKIQTNKALLYFIKKKRFENNDRSRFSKRKPFNKFDKFKPRERK